eukprot:513964-Pyramimonas_sp.AAC.1
MSVSPVFLPICVQKLEEDYDEASNELMIADEDEVRLPVLCGARVTCTHSHPSAEQETLFREGVVVASEIRARRVLRATVERRRGREG